MVFRRSSKENVRYFLWFCVFVRPAKIKFVHVLTPKFESYSLIRLAENFSSILAKFNPSLRLFSYFTFQSVSSFVVARRGAHLTEIKAGKLRWPKCHVLLLRDQRKLSRRLSSKIEKERKLLQEIE